MISTSIRNRKRKPSDPSLRFPKDASALTALWVGLPNMDARTHFLHMAIARDRLDVLAQASRTPLAVGDFVGELQTELRRTLSRKDSVEAFAAIARLSDRSFRLLLGDVDVFSVLEFGSIAVQNKSIQIWKQLLSRGLDPFASGKFGTTLSHMIASHGWGEGLEAIDRLYPNRLSTLIDSSQRTLLHTAARYGKPQMVRWLLSVGADVQARDKNGRSPLFACVLGHTEKWGGKGLSANWQEVAVALMFAGASSQDNSGKTARSPTIGDKLKSHSLEQSAELSRLYTIFVEAVKLEDATTQVSTENKSRRL